jgi:hypothetical protein
MLRKLRPSELGQWAALFQLEPWGEQRADLRSAIVASVIANVNRDPKRKSEPFQPLDFMPYLKLDKKDADADLSRRLKAALSAAGQLKKDTKKK